MWRWIVYPATIVFVIVAGVLLAGALVGISQSIKEYLHEDHPKTERALVLVGTIVLGLMIVGSVYLLIRIGWR